MKRGPSNSLHSRWPIIFAILTIVIGICLSLELRSRVAQTDATKARLTAETLRQNTQQELELFGEVLDSVGALHALSDAVDQAAMDEFIEKGLVYQHAILGPFGLAQRISPQVRSVLEKEAAEQGTGYRVVKQGSDKTWVPAESKSTYYPLTWQSRTEELCIPIGFDFSSIPDALQTIRSIERTRQPALVPSPIPDFSSPSSIKNQKSEIRNVPSPSYWVFAPVVPRQFKHLPWHMPGTVIGFAVAALSPEAVLNRVSTPSGLSPDLKLSLLNPDEQETNQTIRRSKGNWHYRHSLEALGAQWMFKCVLPVSITDHGSTAVLLFGLVITALMTSQLLILGERTRKIETEVNSRTNELHLANIALEKNLLERAHLEEEMNELAANERRRIGRDLHDSLGQKLTGAAFLSRSLLDYLQGSGDRRRGSEDGDQRSTQQPSNQQPATQYGHARTLNETLKSAVAQVRNMARGLAPVALSDESLGEALDQLTEEMTSLYGVSCEVSKCDKLPSLSRRTKEQLYLIAREAVNNAARHAHAERITIQLTGNELEWMLCIKDNGRGLPEAQSSEEGMGIRIMRHRARLIGATFNIQSTPGEGTCITVEGQRS